MTTLIAYLILQATILTGGTTTTSKSTTLQTTTTKCPNTGSGWDDKD